MLFFCSRVSPISVGVPMENLWNSQTPPHPLSPPRFLEGMRCPSSVSIWRMAPKNLLHGRGEYEKYSNNYNSLWNKTNPVKRGRLCLYLFVSPRVPSTALSSMWMAMSGWL